MEVYGEDPYAQSQESHNNIQGMMPAQPVQFTPQSMETSNLVQPTAPHVGQQTFHQAPYQPQVGLDGGVQVHIPVQRVEGWKSGLFDCMDDPMNALVTIIFPCLVFGQMAEIVDEGHTSCAMSAFFYELVGCVIGLPCILSCTYRTKLRSKFALAESPAPDWIAHFFCECCALCQGYRELKHRGFDPSIGWQGNLSRNRILQQPRDAMMVPMNHRMIP